MSTKPQVFITALMPINLGVADDGAVAWLRPGDAPCAVDVQDAEELIALGAAEMATPVEPAPPEPAPPEPELAAPEPEPEPEPEPAAPVAPRSKKQR